MSTILHKQRLTTNRPTMKDNLIQLIIAAALTMAGIGLLYLGATPSTYY